MEVPTFQINDNDLKNIINFIYKQEQALKEFGVIKIQLNIGCKLALKKRRKNLLLYPKTEQIIKMSKSEGIYFVQNVDHLGEFAEQNPFITDECSFWSSLSCSKNESRPVNSTLLANKSFFSEKTSRIYFDIHRLPNQSLLKLGGTKVTRQFTPCIRRAYQPGSIFPLTCTQQRLFSIAYHHEGGDHHWYIIPTRERESLRRIIDQQSSPICLDHGQLFIDPSVLDRNRIRYHRVIQHPNEFIVLSAGTLAQSFTYGASLSESIAFALPSWIEDGHASVPTALCQCNIPYEFLPETIDIKLFTHELIQRYITSHLNIASNGKSLTFAGSLLCLRFFFSLLCMLLDHKNMDTITRSVSNSIETDSSNGI
jgi:hypothetical protein